MKQNYLYEIIRLSYRFPLLTIIIKQVIFWIIAYGVLGFILYFSSLSIFEGTNSPFTLSLAMLILTVLIFGFMNGIILGIFEYFLNKKSNLNNSLGLTILIGSFAYFITIMGLISLTRLIIFWVLELLHMDIGFVEVILRDNWIYHYAILLVYTLFMTLIISFISQIEKILGPGYLLPILLGWFRYPREEERIFMFLDLSNSTRMAEQLGHIAYSNLIQECFLDINKMVKKYNAEIYQYVGDEIVVSWPLEGMKEYVYIEFFFAVIALLQERSKYYTDKFGVTPSFKAGAHVGVVTRVEVGNIKRNLAYHGDTLNVTARLEGLCKELDRSVLFSGALIRKTMVDKKYKISSLGFRTLKGREAKLEVFSID
ncbi:adenylate cyclase [Salegentibacter agarivorans]|uniref:Adenylate cyclase n=1 Tax=Salegentibacter agarivorans TaxID=345907 RepID=A0A1I2PFH9_9FLAO|nr:adenylate/guanylate cyclase domain-containing protein [Salegentibacter agarivorans]SFG14905.1 adenylate cyclase [Salegentibacter agarivorans]